jgi:hypothetical protein
MIIEPRARGWTQEASGDRYQPRAFALGWLRCKSPGCSKQEPQRRRYRRTEGRWQLDDERGDACPTCGRKMQEVGW